MGRNRVPADVTGQLRRLHALITVTAERVLAVMAEIPPGVEIEIGYPADDHEARALGLPCVGAWRAMAARVVARLERPVVLVPRGSTPATAAAIQAREGSPRSTDKSAPPQQSNPPWADRP